MITTTSILRALALLGAVLCAASSAAADASRMFDKVDRQAKALAKGEYRPSPPLPPALEKLDYDDYRLIAFEHERSIWKADRRPFWLECFHRGYLYRDQVALHLVEQGNTRELKFDERLFQYRGKLAALDVPDDTGFAGFRVIGKFETSPHPLEIASFLGASYFRAIGEGQVYGTSCRGLAVDVGLSKPEEFPVFRAFWIERPAEEADRLRFWALLDSPSVAGAYEFVLRPGASTTIDVRARLHFRRKPEKVGLAPLTSMWMWGDGQAAPKGDRRPKVHDADGLLIQTAAKEWIWRPLTQQGYPSLSHYDLDGLRGFGLVQRDRNAGHYLDDEAKYHARPSVWIEPMNAWPRGAVELLELPADHEGIDNIAAWFVPQRSVAIDQPLYLAYRMHYVAGDPEDHSLAKAVKTTVVQSAGEPVRLEIDFASPELARLETGGIEPRVAAQRGQVSDVRCTRLDSGDWRLTFRMEPTENAAVELEAKLLHQAQAVSETWRYLCPK